MDDLIKERKADHISICLKENVQSRVKKTGFEDISLVHKALPEIDWKKIDTSTEIFNYNFSAPIFVGAMTGGTKEATKINGVIAKAIEELNLGMGVGSQRIAIDNPKMETSFRIVRKFAPTAFIMANIGGPQLVGKYGLKEAKKAVEMVEANGLAIHLNTLQEAIQPEGETDYSNLINKITELTDSLEIPVFVKETGAGIAAEEAKSLEEAGIAGIDVAGSGGTSWSAVEYYRSKTKQDSFNQNLGATFWDWGIPTAISLIEVVRSVNIPVISSGGIRNGIDIIKSLALGASLTSLAYPILISAVKGSEEVKNTIQLLLKEIRNTMFFVGADSIEELSKIPVVIRGKTAEWLRLRNFKPGLYARR